MDSPLHDSPLLRIHTRIYTVPDESAIRFLTKTSDYLSTPEMSLQAEGRAPSHQGFACPTGAAFPSGFRRRPARAEAPGRHPRGHAASRGLLTLDDLEIFQRHDRVTARAGQWRSGAREPAFAWAAGHPRP